MHSEASCEATSFTPEVLFKKGGISSGFFHVWIYIDYSLSHNYCEHHFIYDISNIILRMIIFQRELPMPNGVTSAKITLIYLLFSQKFMFENFFQATHWPDFAV